MMIATLHDVFLASLMANHLEYAAPMTEQHSEHGQKVAAKIAPSLLLEIDVAIDVLLATEPTKAGPQWGAMHKLLLRAKVDPTSIMALVMARDGAGLQTLARRLHGEIIAEPAEKPAIAATPLADADTMRSALKAFRKRLKITRLDAESRLGVGPMTGGRSHNIDAIIPPSDFARSVWESLVTTGKLRNTGSGFYALVDDHDSSDS